MYLLLVFLLTFIFINKLKWSFSIKETTLQTILIFSAIIVLITETLSLFHCLNLIFVIGFWGVFSVLLLFFLIKNKKTTFYSIKVCKNVILDYYKSLMVYEKTLLFTIIIGFIALFFQGIIYPPNNWDSLTYHLSRIMYWLGNESVEHYPTHILRELYQPPFVEYCILHINLLNGNDYLSNSVQLLFLGFSIIAIWSVLDFFDTSRFYKLLAAFLLISIPSVEMQASNAKNDIVCGFFIITTLFFAVNTYRQSTLKNFIFLSLSIGLAMLTKGTAYLFLAPILGVFSVFMILKLIKTNDFKIVPKGFLLIFIVIIINIGHFSRNYKINKDVLNIDEVESKAYSNSEMNFLFLYSNLLKNIGLHVGYPQQIGYDAWIRDFHKENYINIDSPSLNYLGIKYTIQKEFDTHEDSVSNYTHLLLIGFFILTLLFFSVKKPKSYQKEILFLFIFLCQIILFAGFLKWQPWHTRLHIPIFMMSIILIIVGAKQFKWLIVVPVVSSFLLLYGFYFNYVYNNLRPIKTNTLYTKYISFKDSRFKKYFANQPQLYADYKAVLKEIETNNPHKVGLTLSDWEYPLFSDYYYDRIQLVAINVNNITSKIVQDQKNIDAIILNTNSKNYEFERIKYINTTPKNSYIWYYKISHEN